MTYEYRIECLPYEAGPDSRAAAFINGLAAQGWRVAHVPGLIPAKAKGTFLDQSAPGLGMVVIFEREKNVGEAIR